MKRRKYSYSDQRGRKRHSIWKILGFIFFFFLYIIITSLFFSSRILDNTSMADNLRIGERFIFSSYNVNRITSDQYPARGVASIRRGNVVLVDMFREKKPGVFIIILDGMVRFFSLQRLGLLDQEEHVFIKRVIGLPGDEITMSNFVIRVKVKGSAYYLTEFEVTDTSYTPAIPTMPALWSSSLPFSGNMDNIILGENECFVLSDDRSNTNDSRTWGPVPLSNISGKALFRYWPLIRFGRV